MTTNNERLIRVPCAIEGHEGDWIEFDTSSWGMAEHRQMYYASLPDCVRFWVERDSVNWHLTGDNGPVPHPGRGADRAEWLSAYKAIGPVAGNALWAWFGSSPILALNELLTVPKKSPAGGEGAGEG